MGMILVRLGDIGYTQESANSIYGSYSTMAISIYNLPSTLISAIALPLIPILTSAIETRDDQKEQIISATALKLTAIVAIPAGLGISVFSKPILSLLFSTQQREIEYTAPLLSILGMSVFLSAMITITNAILQAYKEVKKPIISMIIGTAVKIGLAFYLIGTPEINIYGAPISTLFSLLTIVSLNLYFIVKVNPNVYSVFTLFVKPLIASLISVAAGVFTYIIAQDLINTNALLILAVGEVCLVYLLSVLKLKCIKSSEILMLPAGKKIHRILTQIKLIQ
jgi:stage V sporulation protein B